jgi:hypothetical protein
MVKSATPTKDQYGYTPLQSDGSTDCDSDATTCAKFKIYYKAEKDGTVNSKDSLN